MYGKSRRANNMSSETIYQEKE